MHGFCQNPMSCPLANVCHEGFLARSVLARSSRDGVTLSCFVDPSSLSDLLLLSSLTMSIFENNLGRDPSVIRGDYYFLAIFKSLDVWG